MNDSLPSEAQQNPASRGSVHQQQLEISSMQNVPFIFSRKRWKGKLVHCIYLAVILILVITVAISFKVKILAYEVNWNEEFYQLHRTDDMVKQHLQEMLERAQQLVHEYATNSSKNSVYMIQTSSQVQEAKFKDFKTQLFELGSILKRIQDTYTHHFWFLPDRLFHHYKPSTKTMFFQTSYQIILPSCELFKHLRWSIDRENIHEWNHNPEVVQWAFRYVRPGDHVLYYRPNDYNLLAITVLSKMVGESGSVTIVDNSQISPCMDLIYTFQNLKARVEYASFDALRSWERYTVLVANQPGVKSRLSSSVRSIVHTQDPSKLEKPQGGSIQKISITFYPFFKVSFSSQLSGQGFYSVIPKGQQPSLLPLIKQRQFNSQIRTIAQSRYIRFKQQYRDSIEEKMGFLVELGKKRQCLRVDGPREDSQGFVVTVYGRKLYGASVQEVEGWERERQAVEWVRTRIINQTLRTAYYEIATSFNLLAITEAALLLAPHVLTVVCSEAQCARIAMQVKAHNLTNVRTLPASDPAEALAAGMVITDSEALITGLFESNFLRTGSLLGLFNHSRPGNLAFVHKAYVSYNLREVVLDSKYSECVGMNLRHFFWTSWEPQGYYDITPSSKDVIYAYWGGHPGKLNTRKKILAEQVTTNPVQAKILSAQTFVAFEKPNSPIHPAFYLLTSTQKSDYMRVYLMHHYGGVYTDVKHLHFDMRPYVEYFKNDESMLAMGYAELYGHHVGCNEEEGEPPCQVIRSKYARMIGNGCYLFKKQSAATTEWFKRVTDNLDNKLQDLIKNPPQVPREQFNVRYTLPNGTKFISKYPFRWAEIANEHLARVQFNHLDKFSTALPYIIDTDYRTDDNLLEN